MKITSDHQWLTVEAEMRVPHATVQLVNVLDSGPFDLLMMERDSYWLDMSLAPRPDTSRVRYRERWARQRFERLGRVYLLPPGEEVEMRGDGGAHPSLFCHIERQPLHDWFAEDRRWQARQFDASVDIGDSQVRDLMLRLAQEMRHPGFASELLVESIAVQLAVELGRYFIDFSEPPAPRELAPWRLRLIDERLRDGDCMPSLAELATLCNLSVRQLTRGFRASRHCSIGEYIANERIEQAKRMLAGELSIKAIAYTLGFASPSGFCAAFRRALGVSPGDYRAQLARH